jgi:hypothetical protein
MGTPTSEVGYTSATTKRGDHEVYMDMWWHWPKKNQRNSIGGTGTRLRVGRSGVRIPAGKTFSVLYVLTGCAAQPGSCASRYRVRSWEVKRLGCDVARSHQSNSEVENECGYTSDTRI